VSVNSCINTHSMHKPQEQMLKRSAYLSIWEFQGTLIIIDFSDVTRRDSLRRIKSSGTKRVVQVLVEHMPPCSHHEARLLGVARQVATFPLPNDAQMTTSK
jgi:hypothetical protein